MALNEVAAHASRGGDGALEVDIGVAGKGAEIGAAKGFTGDPDFEVVRGEGGYGEAGSLWQGSAVGFILWR